MIDGQKLWAPGWGEPCDCYDDCDCAEPIALVRVDVAGEAWVTTPFHPVVMLRNDQVEIVGDWADWTDFAAAQVDRVLRRLLASAPIPVPSMALFRRDFLEPILADDDCRVLPTNYHPSGSGLDVHAIMRGEDLIGWICPSDASKKSVVEGDTWMRIPAGRGAR